MALKIFVVDDNKDIVFLMETLLAQMGHDIIGKAYDGKEAIQAFKKLEYCPDIILLDYQMPFFNGLEVAIEILTSYPNCRIIIVSGTTGIRFKAMEIGVKYFIKKPFSFDSLNRAIKEVIGYSKNIFDFKSVSIF